MLNRTQNLVKESLQKVHGTVYGHLNKSATQFLQRHGSRIPLWVTADFVTTGRLVLVFPTVVLIGDGYSVIPASMVLINAAFDYVDGAIARWEKEDHARGLARRIQRATFSEIGVTKNMRALALEKNWGAYYDALADKAFAIPVWCAICATAPHHLWLQTAVMLHVGVEGISAYTRTKSYFLDPEAGSVVTANSTGKVKQTVSMLGTALALLPATQTIGGILLWISLPLSFASLADKFKDKEVKRALLVSGSSLTSQNIPGLIKTKQNYELIICDLKGQENAQNLLSCSDLLDGVVKIDENKLDETEFDRLRASYVFITSRNDEMLIDDKLREREVIKML